MVSKVSVKFYTKLARVLVLTMSSLAALNLTDISSSLHLAYSHLSYCKLSRL